jgi:hypothetical protein
MNKNLSASLFLQRQKFNVSALLFSTDWKSVDRIFLFAAGFILPRYKKMYLIVDGVCTLVRQVVAALAQCSASDRICTPYTLYIS